MKFHSWYHLVAPKCFEFCYHLFCSYLDEFKPSSQLQLLGWMQMQLPRVLLGGIDFRLLGLQSSEIRKEGRKEGGWVGGWVGGRLLLRALHLQQEWPPSSSSWFNPIVKQLRRSNGLLRWFYDEVEQESTPSWNLCSIWSGRCWHLFFFVFCGTGYRGSL